MSDAAFRLTDVCRRLGHTFRLEIDDLTIAHGKATALLGPTGAGKTTLLRLLTGLEYPDDGIVEFNGAPLNRTTPLSVLRTISMIHQRPILINGSVADNVAFGLRARRRDDDSQVADMIGQLGLDRLARQDVRLLSGGQVHLVALARSLVLEPQVLLLDEPTANLDPAYVVLVENAIRDTQLSRGTAVVWATHNMFQARRVSQQVILLLNGSAIETADNAKFFEDPTDSRTAAFIEGKMVY